MLRLALVAENFAGAFAREQKKKAIASFPDYTSAIDATSSAN